jgi:hypothetical protein
MKRISVICLQQILVTRQHAVKRRFIFVMRANELSELSEFTSEIESLMPVAGKFPQLVSSSSQLIKLLSYSGYTD